MKIKTEKVIEVDDWDNLVKETYGRVYSFQQQNGCQERGNYYITVPDAASDYKNDTVPEIVNDSKRGVSLKAWLERDPKQILKSKDEIEDDGWSTGMWWERNFYPDIQMVANDLHQKGLLEAGDYTICIDW